MAATRKRPPLADQADKEPSWRHELFAEWLEAQTGYEADVKSVQLATTLLKEFRASPEFQAATEADSAEREQKAADKAQRVLEKKISRAARLKAEYEAAVEAAGGVDEIPAPAKKTATRKSPAKAPAKAAPPKPPTKPAPPAAASDGMGASDEDDF